MTHAVVGGFAAALLPAVLVGVVAGAPLGVALARQLFRDLGLPGSGDMLGVASGVALVLALVEVMGGALGLGFAKAVIAYRHRRK